MLYNKFNYKKCKKTEKINVKCDIINKKVVGGHKK